VVVKLSNKQGAKLFTKSTPYSLQEKSLPRVRVLMKISNIKQARCEVKKIVKLFTKSKFRIKT